MLDKIGRYLFHQNRMAHGMMSTPYSGRGRVLKLLALTPSGRAVAEAVYERHRFFEQKLTALGVPSEQAHEDACRLEHAISVESFEALRREG